MIFSLTFLSGLLYRFITRFEEPCLKNGPEKRGFLQIELMNKPTGSKTNWQKTEYPFIQLITHSKEGQ